MGAGLAGLLAARTLSAAGVSTVVLEKSGGVGGRIATRRVEGFTFDTGATHLVPREPEMAAAMDLVPAGGEAALRIERPVYTHQYGRISPGDASRSRVPRMAYRDGNTRLAKNLADGLDVRLNARVETIEAVGAAPEAGYRVGEHEADAVILTAPVPQCEALLGPLGEGRAIGHVRYRQCLSVLLGFEGAIDRPFSALLDPEQRHPLTWLSLEHLKVPGRAPEGTSALVAQMSRQYSQDWYDADDEVIVNDVTAHLRHLLGPGLGERRVGQVKRWRYSQPEATAMFETANPPRTRLLIAGDGVAGGRAERAAAVGVQAAERLLAEWGGAR